MGTDDEFVTALLDLNDQGDAGKPKMRAMLKEGGLDRLLKLAARGAGVKRQPPKKEPPAPKPAPAPKAPPVAKAEPDRRTRLPDEFPTAEDKQAAIKYWFEHGRQDLIARLEDEVKKFRAHHSGRGTRAVNWPQTWVTWYSNALEMVRPPRGSNLRTVAGGTVEIEGASATVWQGRLEVFYFGAKPDVPVGSWLPKYGPKPDEPGFLGPEVLLRRIKERLTQRAG